MSDEYFFGITLTSENKEHKWEPDELKENGTGDISLTPKGEHCLILKQAILTKGVEGEVNIVEVETSGYKNQVKIPIAALVGGKTTHSAMDITLPDPPVVLRLIEGSGPVHIAGIHAIQTEQFNDDDDDDDEEFMGNDYETDERGNVIGIRPRHASRRSQNGIDEEEDDDEEVETTEESKPSPKKDAKEATNGKGKRANSSTPGGAPSSKKKKGEKA